jgi:hypothetical protein
MRRQRSCKSLPRKQIKKYAPHAAGTVPGLKGHRDRHHIWIYNEKCHYKVSACRALSAQKLMITE